MSLDLFAPKTPALVGLEIGPASIKMVELTSTRRGALKLERYAIEMLQDQIYPDGTIANIDGLADVIRACHKKLGSKIKLVCTSLPSSMVATTIVNLADPGNEADLEEAIRSEASGQFAMSLEEANLDYQILDRSEEDGQKTLKVFVAASLRARIEERVAAIEAAGLKAHIVDSDQLALVDAAVRWLKRTDRFEPDRNYLLMDVESQNTQFGVLRNDELVYSREHSFGGAQLTREIENRFSVSSDDARRIKSGLKRAPNEDALAEMLASFSREAAQEAKRAAQLFAASVNQPELHGVLIFGGSASVDGIDAAVSEELGVPASMLQPFEGMSLSSSIDSNRLQRDSSALVVTCGLAMRRFDK